MLTRFWLSLLGNGNDMVKFVNSLGGDLPLGGETSLAKRA